MWRLGVRVGVLSAALAAALAGCGVQDTVSVPGQEASVARDSPPPAIMAQAWPQPCSQEAAKMVELETTLAGVDGDVAVPARSFDAGSRRGLVEVSPGFHDRLGRDGLDLLAWQHACAFGPDRVERIDVRDHVTGELVARYGRADLQRLTAASSR